MAMLVPRQEPADAAGFAAELAAVPVEIKLAAQSDTDAIIIRRWLRAHSPGSTEAYLGAARQFFSRVRVPIARVTVPMVQDYQTWLQSDAMGLAPATIHKHLSALKSLFRYAMDTGAIRINPVALGLAHVTAQPPFAAERILTPEEVALIIQAAPPGPHRVMLATIYQCGLRRAEIAALCPSHLHIDGVQDPYLRIRGKGGTWRDVPIVDTELARALQQIARRTPPTHPLFNLTPHGVYQVVKRAVKAAGITKPVSTHWLRHASGSHGRDAGESLESIQRRLGHKRLDTTMIYVHPVGERVPNLLRRDA